MFLRESFSVDLEPFLEPAFVDQEIDPPISVFQVLGIKCVPPPPSWEEGILTEIMLS